MTADDFHNALLTGEREGCYAHYAEGRRREFAKFSACVFLELPP